MPVKNIHRLEPYRTLDLCLQGAHSHGDSRERIPLPVILVPFARDLVDCVSAAIAIAIAPGSPFAS